MAPYEDQGVVHARMPARNLIWIVRGRAAFSSAGSNKNFAELNKDRTLRNEDDAVTNEDHPFGNEDHKKTKIAAASTASYVGVRQHCKIIFTSQRKSARDTVSAAHSVRTVHEQQRVHMAVEPCHCGARKKVMRDPYTGELRATHWVFYPSAYQMGVFMLLKSKCPESSNGVRKKFIPENNQQAAKFQELKIHICQYKAAFKGDSYLFISRSRAQSASKDLAARPNGHRGNLGEDSVCSNGLCDREQWSSGCRGIACLVLAC
eukprot:3506354-Pleurochrysis_carterae.AAC.5